MIGRGVPGLIWSEDFVLQDNSGIIFLDYRQPIRIWEFLFGLMKGQTFRNIKVDVTGWYRRSLVPYIEINTLKAKGKDRQCWVYHTRLAVAVLFILAGLYVSSGVV